MINNKTYKLKSFIIILLWCSLLSFQIYSMEPLESLPVFENNPWISLVPHGEKFKVPSRIAQESKLIAFLQREFSQAGTQEHPFELILHPAISSDTVREFMNSKITHNLLQEAQYLSIAYYLDMTTTQRNLEYTMRKNFKQLEMVDALEQAKVLEALNLSLPSSLLHMLASRKLTQLFFKNSQGYKLCSEECDGTKALATIKNRGDALKALKHRIASFYQTQLSPDFFNVNLEKISTAYPLGILGVFHKIVYNSILLKEIHTTDTLYFSEIMNEPSILKNNTLIKSFAMNKQGTTVVLHDYENILTLYKRIDNDEQQAQKFEWRKIILDTTTPEYFKIIFSHDGNLLLTSSIVDQKINASVNNVEIKVWDNNKGYLVARYLPQAKEVINSFYFSENNTQLILRINHTMFKIFDIASQSIIEQWYDPAMKWNNRIKKHKLKGAYEQQYYLAKYPLTLYNRYNHRLIELTTESLELPQTIQSQLLTAEFDIHNNLMVTESTTGKFCIFNFNALDEILQHVDKLTVWQAVVLLLLSDYEHSNDTIHLRTTINTFPSSIKNLLEMQQETRK